MTGPVLIGGGGYVGGALIKHFDQNSRQLNVVDNFLYGHDVTQVDSLSRHNVMFHPLDLASPADQTEILRIIEESNAQQVVVLAGLVGDPITKKFPEISKSINSVGLSQLIELIDSAFEGLRVIFISTCSNYGMMEDGELATEESELRPLSLYAEAKVEQEKLILEELAPANRNIYTVLRFATAFGLSNRMRFDLTVNQFTRELALGHHLEVFDADTWRPYCHVSDFARLIDIVSLAPVKKIAGEVFNAGSDFNNFTKRALIEEIRKFTKLGEVTFKEDGGDPRNYRVDFSKVKNVLNFEAQKPVSEGIREVVDAVNNGFFRGDVSTNLYGNYHV